MQALELSQDAKNQIARLKVLGEKAEHGDKEAREELRQAVRESSPEVIARVANLTRKRTRLLARTATADTPLTEEALVARLELMRAELGGENPSPLESLLVEKIVGVWMVTELLDVFMSAQLFHGGENNHRLHPRELKPWLDWQERANRQLLRNIKTLATVRRLQSGLPNSQMNVQFNVSYAPEEGEGRPGY